MTEATRILRRHGAEEIWAFVIHGLLVGPAVERIKESPIERLVTTDSVRLEMDDPDLKLTILSVSQLLGKAIMCIHKNESVSSLFS